jgi:hypothetical protein
MHTVAGAGRGQAGSNFALKVLLHVLHVSSMATHLTDHRQTSNRLTAETRRGHVVQDLVRPRNTYQHTAQMMSTGLLSLDL